MGGWMGGWVDGWYVEEFVEVCFTRVCREIIELVSYLLLDRETVWFQRAEPEVQYSSLAFDHGKHGG